MANMQHTDIIEETCFGWDRPTDERSLRAFLKKFGSNDFLDVLIPRLSDKEITAVVEQLTKIMKDNLSEREYHRLFLK
jgi:hypothetical protein